MVTQFYTSRCLQILSAVLSPLSPLSPRRCLEGTKRDGKHPGCKVHRPWCFAKLVMPRQMESDTETAVQLFWISIAVVFFCQLETWKLTLMNLYSNFYEMSGGLWSLWWHRHVGSMHFLSRFKCCEHPPIRQIISNNVRSICKQHVRSKPRKPCCLGRIHRLPHC